MSYYTHDYVFGQNDKDALQRIHADKIIMQTKDLENEAQARLSGKIASQSLQDKLNQVGDRVRESEELYAKMSYPESLKFALEARNLARSAVEEIDKLPSLPVLYTLGGLGIGLAVAVVVFLVLSRQTIRGKEPAQIQVCAESPHLCSSCGRQMAS